MNDTTPTAASAEIVQMAMRALPVMLALVGIALPLVGSNFAVWPLSIVWLLVLGIVIVFERRSHVPSATRVFWGVIALPVLFLFGWEGGWWLMPAVFARVLVDAWTARAEARRRGAFT
jgi:hypothetical protein